MRICMLFCHVHLNSLSLKILFMQDVPGFYMKKALRFIFFILILLTLANFEVSEVQK